MSHRIGPTFGTCSLAETKHTAEFSFIHLERTSRKSVRRGEIEQNDWIMKQGRLREEFYLCQIRCTVGAELLCVRGPVLNRVCIGGPANDGQQNGYEDVKGSTPAQLAHPKAFDQDGNNALAHASCAQIQFRVENNAAVGSMNTTSP